MGADLPDWWSRVQAVMELEFLKLVDTPATYSGAAGKVPEVSAAEDALEWSDCIIDDHSSRHEEGGADEVTGITGKLNNHSDRHESGGSDELNLAACNTVPAALTTHIATKTGIHGVGTNYVAETSVEDIDLAAHKTRHQNLGNDEISIAGLDGEPSTLTTHKDLTTGIHGVGTKYIAESAVENLDLAAHKSRHDTGGADVLTAVSDAIIGDNGRFELRANRDVANGYPVLGAGEYLNVKGAGAMLTRDVAQNIYLCERTSGEDVLKINRVAANDFDAFLNESGVYQQILTNPHKDADDHAQYRNPWLIDIDVFNTPGSASGWGTLTYRDTAVHNASRDSDGDVNNEITWPVVLVAGTWTFSLMYVVADSGGIFSVQLDGVQQGTIDSYEAAEVVNTTGTITGITVSTSGKYTLKLKMATKNASSSAYYGRIQHVRLIRTA